MTPVSPYLLEVFAAFLVALTALIWAVVRRWGRRTPSRRRRADRERDNATPGAEPHSNHHRPQSGRPHARRQRST
jgi:hypothetical protein